MEIAVIKTGGKQYLVKPGQQLKIEKIKGEKGDQVKFDQVLLFADEAADKLELGRPYIKDFAVQAEIMLQARSRKIEVVKYKAKTRYKKTYGHRQSYTKVKITQISGQAPAKKVAKQSEK